MVWAIIGVGAVVLAAIVVVFKALRKDSSPVGVVMLRTKPRRLTEADVRSAYRRVHKKDPRIERVPIDQTTSSWLIVSEDHPVVGIIDSARMYAEKEEMEAVARRHEHPQTRWALAEHTSWVSVDAMGVNKSIGKNARSKIYTLLAPIAAELMDADCMLLYLPAESRVGEAGEKGESMLRAGRVAELFGDEELHAPLIMVGDEDVQINAAIEEARRRLPEFCAAWEELGAGTNGMIKGRFESALDGETGVEYIWVKVVSMTDEGFEGTILNNPVAKNIPRKGARACVKLDDVVDWASSMRARSRTGCSWTGC